MVMRTYLKTIIRSVKNNAAKFISIIFIMMLGIAFVAGLGTLSPSVKHSLNVKMNADNFSDIIVKSKSQYGFTPTQIEDFKNLDYVEAAVSVTAVDGEIDGVNTRIYAYGDFSASVNKLEIEGKLPSADNEILTERASNEVIKREIGDEVNLYGRTYKIVGIVSNPQLFDRYGEPDTINLKPLKQIFYFSRENCPLPLPVTDLHMRLYSITARNYFSESYKNAVDARVDEMSAQFGDGFVYLTVRDNKSCNVLESYCKKINVITLVFPIFFTLIAALTVMITLARMVEEERPQIGCLSSLGFSDGRIIFKYMFLTALSCVLAEGLGFLIGLTLLPAVIYPAFNVLFFMPPASKYVNPLLGMWAFIIMFIVVMAVTYTVCVNRLRERPAALLTAKAPKPGKKILLERIGFIWNKLSFKYKSTMRNLFRYKKHLVMTLVSVAGSTAMTFAGFSLWDAANAVSTSSFAGMKDSMNSISAVVIIFALLLGIFVVYNLINLNIGERKREIATLDVLGYRKAEILGYIYREIIIMSAIGALLGIAFGCGLVQGVLGYIEFGSLADVKWYSYLLSYGLELLFIVITGMMLTPKIFKINMATSLKSND